MVSGGIRTDKFGNYTLLQLMNDDSNSGNLVKLVTRVARKMNTMNINEIIAMFHVDYMT